MTKSHWLGTSLIIWCNVPFVNYLLAISYLAFATSPAAAEGPLSVSPTTQKLIASKAAGTVYVVRPVGWSKSLATWKAYRMAQGYVIREIDSQQTAEATRAELQKVVRESDVLPRFVLIGSDSPAFQSKDSIGVNANTTPTFYVDSQVVKNFGSEPTIASDYPYSDLNGDGIFDVVYDGAVGRIPAQSPKEMEEYLGKVIRYESKIPQGDMGRKIDVVAGVGGFGAIADTVIEGVTKQILCDDIPSRYRLTMMYASEGSNYCPPMELFPSIASSRLSEGSLFWVYLGHGYINTLDYVRFGDRQLPIFEDKQAQQLKIDGMPPLAIFLACYVGAFDASRQSIAELLVMNSDGPIASIASTRVTMPYAMAVMGKEMLQQALGDETHTAGQILYRSKLQLIAKEAGGRSENDAVTDRNNSEDGSRHSNELLDNIAKTLSPPGHSIELERLEHAYLFNYLGDPTLKVFKAEPLSIQISRRANTIVFSGDSDTSGKLSLEVAYDRKATPEMVRKLRQQKRQLQKSDEPNKLKMEKEKQLQIFEASNSLTVFKTDIDVKAGEFSGTFDIPMGLSDDLILHCDLRSESSWLGKTFQLPKLGKR